MCTGDTILSLWVHNNRLSIHYGYNFNILNTFKMGLFKKLCSHIPSKMDPSRPPGILSLAEGQPGLNK